MGGTPGERLLPRVLDLPGATLPRRLESEKNAKHAERVAADPALNPLAFLMAPAKDATIAAVNLFHAGGRDAEGEEVFRRILKSGATLDQVEIACASESYSSL